ncbi:MAG: TetR/AcrR family transcriptional regulator [Hyphomicrobiales bacterium]|nr:TetR/AcrR family transcriptional regulator [Hyphomicrobiales bacterium]MCP5000128.1 TetR/AcrR family transcriptional regulator [Hyphomicrobiales bacterium]
MNSDTRRKPRQKRSREKVDKILDAVETLATEQGLEALTTTQIADSTGFAVGTIYQYFGNRTELLIAAEVRMFERLTEQLAAEVMRVLSEPVDEPIEQLIGIYIDSAKSQPGYLALLKFSVLNKPPGVNEATVHEFTGDLISAFVRAEHPNISDAQLSVTIKTVVSILSVLTDVVLLEPDPDLQSRYQAELVAQCKYALQRAGEQAG